MAQAKGSMASRGDLVRFVALQHIKEIERPEVIIPYGEKLAQAVNPAAIRLRHDFPAVLTLIKAHALLHAYHRKRDGQGTVMATLADYEAVYDLVADLLDAMVTGEAQTVDQKIEKAVAAVTELSGNDQNQEGVNQRRIAAWLKVSEKTAWRWVQKAMAAGYLVNKETRKWAEAQIILGKPINDHILPAPQLLSSSV